MGSSSDWETMSACVKTLDQLGIANQAHVLSAHRTPDATAKFAREAADRGIRVMIAAAGARPISLAGVISAYTWLPVLGVPIQSSALHGLDSLLSIAANAGRHSRWYTRHWLRGREEMRALFWLQLFSHFPTKKLRRKSSGVSQKAD